ncbi:MAG: class I SAM-dependent methyltransferase [Chloroflexi bacterium]|nr:class I SAM-dependent methyltransferase [Chloroflexota bacterium]
MVAGDKMNRMYDEFAHLWPLISHHSDYEMEAVHWRNALTSELGQGRLRILELGVGGGNNLHHILYPNCDDSLSADAACHGEHMRCDLPAHDATVVDPSAKMLANCKRLNPTVAQHIGDMRTIRLHEKFDAVLIHDAVCYLMSENDIGATLATAREHLRDGGVLIMAPDWYTETYPGTQLDAGIRRDVTPEFVSIEFDHDPDPDDNMLESVFVYIFKGADGCARVEIDRHITGIFPLSTWLALMEAAGFHAKTLPYPVHEDGRDGWLLVGKLNASGDA